MLYLMLLNEAESQGVKVYERSMGTIRGLYSDSVIWLNQGLTPNTEKICVLAEELGHYYTTSGDILNLTDVRSRKQEKRARNWGYEKLIPLQSFVEASKEGVTNWYELAEFLEITEKFLEEAIAHYKEKYGLYVEWTSYLIYFDPLGVLELFDD